MGEENKHRRQSFDLPAIYPIIFKKLRPSLRSPNATSSKAYDPMTEEPPPTVAGTSRSTSHVPNSTTNATLNSTSSGLYNPYHSLYPNTPGVPTAAPGAGAWPTNWYQYYNTGGLAAAVPTNLNSETETSGSQPYNTHRPQNGTTVEGFGRNYAQKASHYVKRDVSVAQNLSTSTPIPPTASSGPITRPTELTKPPIPHEEPPKNFEHWDEVLRIFLVEAKLGETSKGLEADMLVLGPDWEKMGVYRAVGKMIGNFQALLRRRNPEGTDLEKQNSIENPPKPCEGGTDGLDTRKLSYVIPHLMPNETARTPTSMTKSISQFLARSHARNNASNRTEFLYSLAEKRKQLEQSHSTTENSPPTSSCARTDARPLNRESQMKYDIAKNNDGPLSRTKAKGKDLVAGAKRVHDGDLEEDGAIDGRRVRMRDESVDFVKKEEGGEEDPGTPSRYPAIDERLKNVEMHFGVRYVPSPPRTLLARLKFLEEHIIKLEKEYPPWAALWFCQPGRGWPPPPRTTPIVVPPNLRSNSSATVPKPAVDSTASTPTPSSLMPTPGLPEVKAEDASSSSTLGAIYTPPPGSTHLAKGKAKPPKKKSSLHRAVMEKLEVQKALEDYRAGT